TISIGTFILFTLFFQYLFHPKFFSYSNSWNDSTSSSIHNSGYPSISSLFIYNCALYTCLSYKCVSSVVKVKSPIGKPVTCAIKRCNNEYCATLNGNPKNVSEDLAVTANCSFPPITPQ